MDILLLRTFLEIARTRHFGKAADSLFITASAVSARIKLLESNLGVALFSRKRNDIQLTPAGNRLLKHAETIVRGWERARNEIALDPQLEQALAVGCPYDMWGILLREWSTAIKKLMPQVCLQVEIHPGDILVQRLVSGVLDLIFLFEPPQISGLEIRHITETPLVLVASRPGLTVSEALETDYVMVEWGSSFALSHAEFFPDLPPPNTRMGAGSLALDTLLSVGGAAYLAEQMIQREIDESLLFRVENAPVINRAAFALYRTEIRKQKLVNSALDIAKDTSEAGYKLLLQNQLDNLRRLAFHDSLTGLANRALFREQLAIAMARADRRLELISVMMLDLDGFKEVNDQFGHRTGDELLRQLAQRFNSLIRHSDSLARLGGDEFVFLLDGVKSTKDVDDVARKILEALEAPFEVNGEIVQASASLGAVFYPFENIDLDTLIHQADTALYNAKAEGKGCIAFYQRQV